MKTPTIINENKSVLFISNSPEQFTSAASLLEGEGYQVLFEKESNQGLKTARAKTPGMIVSELAVPNIDGLEICYRVREESDLGGTPVLLVGDLSRQSAIVADGFLCGASDYLQKPFGGVDLVESLRGLQPSDHESVDEIVFDLLSKDESEMTFVVDDQGTIKAASESIRASLGYDPSEVAGRPIFDLVHKADNLELREYLHSMNWGVTDQEPIDHRVKQADGSWTLMESSGRVVTDQKAGVFIVLTSREQNEKCSSFEQMIKNDILRNALFENAGVGIAIFSSQGRLVRSNPALLKMLDHGDNELRDMLLAEIVVPRNAEQDKAALVEITSGRRQYYKFENGYINPRGERVWGALTLVAIPKTRDEEAFLIGIFEEPSVARLGDSTKRCVKSPFQDLDGAAWSDGQEWKVAQELITEN